MSCPRLKLGDMVLIRRFYVVHISSSGPAFFMGDIYGHTLQGVSRRLEAGKHQLRSIVVGKASAKFRCEVNRAPGKAKASIKALAKPDIVGGKLFSNLVSVALSNPTTGWLEANVVPARTKRTPAHVQVLSGKQPPAIQAKAALPQHPPCCPLLRRLVRSRPARRRASVMLLRRPRYIPKCNVMHYLLSFRSGRADHGQARAWADHVDRGRTAADVRRFAVGWVAP